MDVFAHTLWTNVVFHAKYHKQRKMRYLAAFFGVLPDLVGFAPLFVYLFVTGKFFQSNPREMFLEQTHWTMGFAQEAYNYTHSLVIFALVFIVIAAIVIVYRFYKTKQWKFWIFWPLLGWPLHVLIDIPTHPEFYHTPFLFPLSDIRNTHGVSWAHPAFMAINYGCLVLAYILLYICQKKKYQKPIVEGKTE